MAAIQKYGIKYPFTSDNDLNLYLDVNDTYEDGIKSKVLHVLFTPKGQKLRDPEFGTDLIKFLFEPNDSLTANDVVNSIRRDINRYVPEVEFKDITTESMENDGMARVVFVRYTIKGSDEITTVAVRI